MRYERKFIFCSIYFIFLLLFVNLAAIVSDNDGSAFVTKSEFEGLKNDFSEQIKKYNSSLDNKIDGAIASYLAGLEIKKVSSINSLLYSANKAKPVSFVREWEGPTTKLTNNYKHASLMVYVGRGAAKTASDLDFTGFGQVQVKGFDNPEGRYGLKMKEENSEEGPSVVAKYYSNNGKPYINSDGLYKVIPWASFSGATVTFSTSWEINCYTGSEVTFSSNGGNDINFALKTFGASTDYQAHVVLDGGGTVGNADIPMVYACGTEDTNVGAGTSDYGRQYLDLLAGNKIDESLNIIAVENDDWQKTYMSPMTICNDFTYQGNANGAQYVNATTKNTFARGTGHAGFNISGELQYPVYNKNHESKLATSFYQEQYCDTSRKDVKYYTGIPLFELGEENLDVNVTLNFKSNLAATGGKFSIRDDAFDNAQLQDSNVKITKSFSDDTDFTDFDIDPSSGVITKSFCVKGNKNKTYWLKVSPSADNIITVTSPEIFQSTAGEGSSGGGGSSTLLYKFGVISDTHVDYNETAQNNCKYLLNTMKTDNSVNFVVSCGDQTENGSDDGWNVWKQVVNDSDIDIEDVYECVGNHEVYGGVDAGTQRFKNHARSGTLTNAYYSFDKFGDRFIIAAQEGLGTNYSTDCFSTTQLNWIREQISTYTGSGKIILIFHQGFDGWGSGDIPTAPVYTGNLKTNPASSYPGNVAFKQILINNPKMITFHGHTHVSLKEINKGVGFVGYSPPGASTGGCHNFHCPGSRNMKEYNSTGTTLSNLFGDGYCEGWIVERYNDKTVLTAINGKSGETVYGPITIY